LQNGKLVVKHGLLPSVSVRWVELRYSLE
jgi:hypothetical protein